MKMSVVPEWGCMGLPAARERCGFESAHYGRADGDDAAGTASGGVYGGGGLGRDGVALAVQMHFVDALHAQRREGAEADVESDTGDFDAACSIEASICGVKCSPAVGAATEPRSRAKTVW